MFVAGASEYQYILTATVEMFLQLSLVGVKQFDSGTQSSGGGAKRKT
jgi:hypothetical protein